VAAEVVLLLHEHDPCPALGGGEGGRHASGSRSGYEHVGMGVPLVVLAVAAASLDLPPGSEALQHLLVGGPQSLRLDKGLVVEARTDEPPDQLVGGPDVEAERRPGVLGAHRHPGGGFAVGSPDVRLVVHLEHAAGVMEAGREQTAWAVVLEAAREDPIARGCESRDDRVPLEGLPRGAVETELERPSAVDHLRVLRLETHGLTGSGAAKGDHDGASGMSSPGRPVQRTSFETV
jgi:hypothetical protein